MTTDGETGYTFASTYKGSSYVREPRHDPLNPMLRAIRIDKPAKGSHHKEGDFHLQPSEEYLPNAG